MQERIIAALNTKNEAQARAKAVEGDLSILSFNDLGDLASRSQVR